ncbi:restriction endonuclease subunit S [Enterococcus lactis]|uniref:restriction endonuclease subunit S n=1 Tax=Enterococcus lactis TaxID=357441 RepID=UPI002948AA71|nr:restriction endonuclease subunit S [Enterococcus lactis]MDV5138345.1 restriction endonuclease subunit S [Enterococcus lactis]
MSKDKQPEIRFPGFTEDWEERKLDEIFGKIRNAFVGTATPYYVDEGHFYLESNNVKDGRINRNTEVFINDEFYEKQKDKWLHTNDIVMVQSGHVGHTAVIPEDLDKTAAHALIMFSNYKTKTSPFFLNYQFQTLTAKRKLENITTGNTIKHILASEMKKFEVTIPEHVEQQKIGSFFKQLDDTITLHQRKLDLLKETKKGFLQKMFPKNGAKVPEIRFPGFTEDWEQRRLSDVASIVGGGTPSTSNPEYWDGDIDWYAPAEIGDQIYVSKSLKTITELGQQKSSAKILPIGTVLFTSRAGIGNTAILAKEGTTNQGFQSIVPHKNKLDSYFIFSRTHELKRYGEVTGAGSTFAEVSGKQMAKMPILIPCINEQRKIGAFFEQLDTTITLHQRELDVLKETKKGFLQKMFV